MCAANNTNLRMRKWLETPIVGGNKVKKQKSKASIKWEVFQEFENIEKDEFWMFYWERASKGKFPTGFFFNGKTLSYNNRNTTYVTNLKDDVDHDYKLVKHMFQTNGNIYSPTDLEKISKLDFVNKESVKPQSRQLKWSDYNKMQQNNLIDHFVKKISKQKKLTKEEELRISQTIHIGIVSKRITDNDILVEDDRISDIYNIEWIDEINGFFITTPYVIKHKKTGKKTVKTDYGKYPRWNKWIMEVDGVEKKNKNKVIEIDIDAENEGDFSSTIC